MLAGNYLFQRSGTTWAEGAPPAISELGSFSVSENYLAAIDGNVAVITFGTSYAFRRVGTSWFFQERLLPNDATPYDWLSTLAVSGNTVLAGAPRVGERVFVDGEFLSNGPGAGYLFQLSETAIGPPGAPVNVQATVTGNSVLLNWAAPIPAARRRVTPWSVGSQSAVPLWAAYRWGRGRRPMSRLQTAPSF